MTRASTITATVVIALIGASNAAAPASVKATAGEHQSSKCIALVLPSVRGADSNASDVASSLRELIASFLNGPSLKAMLLEARLPQQALEEAREKGCSRVLTTTLTRKRSSGGLGKALGQAAGAAAWQVPYGGGIGGAAVRGAAMGGAAAVSSMASNTRAKDELRLEYRLLSADGSALKDETATEKAKTDGEDLVTPLVERMATVVASLVAK